MQETRFDSWVRKICWRRDRLPTPVFLGFPCGSAGKESTCNVGDLGSIPELGRSPGEGKGYPLQYSGLENSMEYIVHGVTKSRTWLSHFHWYVITMHWENEKNQYFQSYCLEYLEGQSCLSWKTEGIAHFRICLYTIFLTAKPILILRMNQFYFFFSIMVYCSILNAVSCAI